MIVCYLYEIGKRQLVITDFKVTQRFGVLNVLSFLLRANLGFFLFILVLHTSHIKKFKYKLNIA